MGSSPTDDKRGTMTKRGKRILLTLMLVALALLVVAFVAVEWYLSGRIIADATIRDDPPSYPEEVVASQPGTVALEMTEPPAEDPKSLGITGIRIADGAYQQAGTVMETEGQVAVRDAVTVLGDPPEAGEQAGLDSYYFPEDPSVGMGLEFSEVDIPSELGPMPAWYVPGEDDTWAVFTHGRGAPRREGLRMLDIVHGLGYPTLLISYRDDAGAPYEDGIANFGPTEWRDVEAAVAYALANGAQDVVLLGASTGGAISLAFLENSELAEVAVGLFMDSPVTSLRATVEQGVEAVGAPGFLVPGALWLTERRVNLDFTATDYVSRAEELTVPTVIVHGDEDSRTPLSASEEFVANAPDGLATLEVFPDTEHVYGWNTDRDRYTTVLTEHLRTVAPVE
jgi:pimeloyl-ACP methyl ester carboxylesterase